MVALSPFLRIGRVRYVLPLALLSAHVLTPSRLSADETKVAKVVLEVKGYVFPASRVTVCPKVSGQVVELRIEEGQRVRAGDVLARLDPAEFQAAVRLARAELRLAEAGVTKAREGAGKGDLAVALAQVEVAQARVAIAQRRLDCAVVRAPVSGTVLAKRAEVGTLILPGGASGTTSLCDLADLRAAEVELWIPEKDLARVVKGRQCLVRVDALPHATFRGRVARVLPLADKARGAIGVRVRLDVPEKNESLRPEMSAIVQVLDKE